MHTPAFKQIRHCNKGKPFTQPFKNQRDRFKHRAPVRITFFKSHIKCVVKINHAAGLNLANYVLRHPIRTVIQPILGNDIPIHYLVTEPICVEAGRQILMAIGRTKEFVPVRSERPGTVTHLL